MILYKSLLGKKVRTYLGVIVLIILLWIKSNYPIKVIFSMDIITTSIITFLIWLISITLTDKYVHKYPQRYLTYTLSKNMKALAVVIVMIFVLFISSIFERQILFDIIWVMFILSGIDFILDLFVKKEKVADINKQMENFLSRLNNHNSDFNKEETINATINQKRLFNEYGNIMSNCENEFIRNHITNSDNNCDTYLIVNKKQNLIESKDTDFSLIIYQTSLNNIKRLNNTIKSSIRGLKKGGYFIVNYTPMEYELEKLKKETSKIKYPFKYISNFIIYRGLIKIKWLSNLYFAKPFSWIDAFREKYTSGKRRSLARAEVWGRLVYYGMEIIDEKIEGERAYLIAQKVSEQSANKTPTYHAVVTLEKVGLCGSIIRLHKVRSMYPFSEFLQKNLYNMHGLTNTGKFKNDFRLTDYGPFIRKYWIDEIPGIIDWLKGDIKLVGMRATSPQYLSLYPKDIIEKYMQVKPGLVPPIFDEKTAGFDQIVQIEGEYLDRYLSNPTKTDFLYLWYTFRDIFIRKVRSK
ncbi:sugar transferase [Mobilitalea sibirica]|uniref:Sugar transferase n=1 Tax=Mobilitalea sibirica TaxID=1462919 RepID=A0A8J7H612_9FIRM|nr:sugar transferase [Mobilitalea sibirica]MBH1942044.1 sugar transferase [Mobilitalea sibirica]